MRLLHWLRYLRSDSSRRSGRPGRALRYGAHVERLEGRLPLGDALFSALVSASWLSDQQADVDGDLTSAMVDPLPAPHPIATWPDTERSSQPLPIDVLSGANRPQPAGERPQIVVATEQGMVWQAPIGPFDDDTLLLLSGAVLADQPLAPSDPGAAAAVCARSQWIYTGSMNYARQNHTATRVGNQVLVVGGQALGGPLPNPVRTAELYDIATGTWTLTTPPNDGWFFHTAAQLPDGRVLVVGWGTSEIFDPADQTWTDAGFVPGIGASPASTLLSDGRVLVTGGCSDWGGSPEAFLYDQASGWTVTPSMYDGRCDHTMTLLLDGTVLVAGGRSSEGSFSLAEVYDPATQSWSRVANMARAGGYHTATRLQDGRVLVAGSASNTSTEIYDPATRTWSYAGDMSQPRSNHDAISLGSCGVLVAGGGRSDISGTELYRPDQGTWVPSPNMNAGRAFHTLTEIGPGKVLAVGGRAGSSPGSPPTTNTAEIFDVLRLHPRPVG